MNPLARLVNHDFDDSARGSFPDGPFPEGFLLELPGRGSTFVTDNPGPPDAPTVLLLHGAGCTGLLTWFPAIADLQKHFRVVTMDQRGHGQSVESAVFTLHDCADDVAAVVEALGLEQVLVMGHSMGSVVAQRVWRQHPDIVAGLVLCSTTDRFRASPTAMVFFGGMELSLAASRRRPNRGKPTAKEPAAQGSEPRVLDETQAWMLRQWRSTRPGGLAQAVVACGRHHSTLWISTIDVPTAVVVTNQDRVIPAERQRAFAMRIPGATIHEVNAGHSSCITKPEVFVPGAVEAAIRTAQRAGLIVE